MAHNIRRALLFDLLLLATCTAVAAEQQAIPDEIVAAVWQQQHIDLNYVADNSFYTCAAFEQRLRSLLRRVGARDDFAIQMGVCPNGAYVMSSRMRLSIAAPVAATEENIRATTTYSNRRLLVAKVRGEHLPTAGEVRPFAATWQRVHLTRDRKLQLQSGDCKLLRELSRQVFPKIGVQLLTKELDCPSRYSNYGLPRIEIMALMAAPELEPDATAFAAR